MNIENLCYELYKIDWMDRISTECKKDTLKNYYEAISEKGISEKEYTFNNYLLDFGYNGECYVGFEEFLDFEFLDAAYMKTLLNDNQYIEYLNYVKNYYS